MSQRKFLTYKPVTQPEHVPELTNLEAHSNRLDLNVARKLWDALRGIVTRKFDHDLELQRVDQPLCDVLNMHEVIKMVRL